MIGYSLAEKNRDLNQAFEKAERMESVKDKLTHELGSMKISLSNKDDEIEQYDQHTHIDISFLLSLV